MVVSVLYRFEFRYPWSWVHHFGFLCAGVGFVVRGQNAHILGHELILVGVVESRAFDLVDFGVGVIDTVTQVSFVVDALHRLVPMQGRVARRQHIGTVFTSAIAWVKIWRRF